MGSAVVSSAKAPNMLEYPDSAQKIVTSVTVTSAYAIRLNGLVQQDLELAVSPLEKISRSARQAKSRALVQEGTCVPC